MPKRRITIPEDHVALVLSPQLAVELMSLMRVTRRVSRREWEKSQSNDPAKRETFDPQVADSYTIAGDIILALLEAKEF